MRSPIVACLVGAVVYLVLLGLSAGVIDATHSDVAGEAVALLGAFLGCYAGATIAVGATLDRVVAGVVPILLGLVLALGVAYRYGHIGPDVLGYSLAIVLVGSLGIVVSLRGGRRSA